MSREARATRTDGVLILSLLGLGAVFAPAPPPLRAHSTEPTRLARAAQPAQPAQPAQAAQAAQAGAAARPGGPAVEAVEVRFELNDAQVKGRLLPGVSVSVLRPGGGDPVAAGITGADGRFASRVAPGSYQVSYRLDGYVPYTSEATELVAEGQLVTVSLSRMLEATGVAGRDVRIVLNWGSQSDQVKDADSHLACACGATDRHVFYKARQHQAGDHGVELDVDDTDWGGPETITISRPAKGRYLYWVHDYSGDGAPAVLGTSGLVVRVLIGSEPHGELRVPKGLTRRAWRPFNAIDVGADGVPTLVRWSEDEIAEGRDLEVPAELQPLDSQAAVTPTRLLEVSPPRVVTLSVIALIVILALRRARRRRA